MPQARNEIIAERNRLLKQLQKLEALAFTDQLTGLSNRHALLADLVSLSKHRNQRKSEHMFGMLVLDIDWFKKINDEFNHLTGDKVLKTAAQIMSESIKESTFREGDKVYRLGGEEFLVLLPAISREGLSIVAERIRKNIADHLRKSLPAKRKKSGNVTVSIGGKTYSPTALKTAAANPEKLLHKLLLLPDKYMYQAKSAGRNCAIINGKTAA